MAGVDHLVVYMQIAVKYSSLFIHHPGGGVLVSWWAWPSKVFCGPQELTPLSSCSARGKAQTFHIQDEGQYGQQMDVVQLIVAMLLALFRSILHTTSSDTF